MKRKRIIGVVAGMLLGATTAFSASQPEFPGGAEALDNYITSNMKYPASAKANGIEGVVDVAFVVKADGTIGSIKIVRMVDPDLEAEAIRLIKGMPNWLPADENGTPVDSQTQVGINFVLPSQ